MTKKNNTVASVWTNNQTFSDKQPSKSEVVIIGGGIIGVSTAYYLAKAGIEVSLFEKGCVSGEQSSRNWGWVRVQGRDEREIPMMLRSLEIWRGLSEEIGFETGYREKGCLYSAYNQKEMNGYQSWLDLAKKYDIETKILEKADLIKEAGFVANKWVGGIITKTDGRAEPHLATIALTKAAIHLGAKIYPYNAVRGIEKTNGKLSSVITEHGRVRTSTAVCAAGAWSSYFCQSLGIQLPQLRVKGTVARTSAIDSPILGNIFDKNVSIRKRLDGGYTVADGTILNHSITPSTLYFAPKYIKALAREFKSLRISIGKDFIEEMMLPKKWELDKVSPFEKNRILNPKPNNRIIKKIKKNVGIIFPELRDIKIIETWAGMVETTPDVIPVVSPVSKIPGLILATGFSGHGFGIAPGAGEAICNLIQNKSTIDLNAFRLDRFYDGSPITVDAHI